MTIFAVGNKLTMRIDGNQGFTLLELMLAVLVMALVLAVAYPALSRGSAALHLRATGRDMLNIFRYAREKAVTEQTGMKVIVDRENQKITLTDALGDGSREYYLPPDVRIHRLSLAGNATDGPLTVRFLPNGCSDNAEILIVSSSGSGLQIISDPITGGAAIRSAPGGGAP